MSTLIEKKINSNSITESVQAGSVEGSGSSKMKRIIKVLILKPLKISGYSVLLVGMVALLFWGVEKLAQLGLTKTYLGDVYPENIQMARKDLTIPVSFYDYDLTPGVCLIHAQDKGNRLEYANNAGFRDPRDIAVKKPDDEFRIFLTGGSTAFGLGSAGSAASITGAYYLEQRETVSHVIEKILNAKAPLPGKNIRVYNTAVWGHAYQHDLLRYLTKLRRYSPDLVVSLDGVNEIHPVSIPVDDWDYFSQGQYSAILKQIFSFEWAGLSSYLTLWLKNNTFLMTLFWRGNDVFQNLEGEARFHKGSLFHSFGLTPEKDRMKQEQRQEMITENMTVVNKVIQDYHNALLTDGVPHIFALQPMLYASKKARHAIEKQIEGEKDHQVYYEMDTGHLYSYMIRRILDNSKERGIHAVNFADYFNDTDQWVFTDWCHLTAGANYLIGKEIANQILSHYFNIALDESDLVRDKNLYFVNLARSAKVVSAPEAANSSSPVSSILRDFPGDEYYSSVSVPPGSPLELVVDLENTFEVSRIRIFWADESSVPNEWKIDVSENGQTWTNWIVGSDDLVDGLSLSPALDYYSSRPVNARYIRYSSEDPENRKIAIRAINVFR